MKNHTLWNSSSTLALVFISTFLIMCGCGMFNTLFSLKIKVNSGSSMIVGLLSSFYFSGMLLGSFKISLLIRRVGYVNSFVTVATLMAVSVVIPIISSNIILWSLCRAIQGFCVASLFVVLETWVLCSYSDKMRAKALSHYMIVLYSSYAIGQLFFFKSNSNINSDYLFCLAAILINISIIPLVSFSVVTPPVEKHVKITMQKILKASSAGFVGCLVSGMLISTIIAMLPIYIQEVNPEASSIAFIMFIVFVAGVSMQYPISYLSDRFNREKLQIFLNIGFTVFLSLFIYWQYSNKIFFSTLPFISVIIGVFSFAIYPLSTHLICDSLKKNEIIKGIELVMVSYGIGSIIGPVYIAWCMKIFGIGGYFIGYVALSIFLFISNIILRKNRKLQ